MTQQQNTKKPDDIKKTDVPDVEEKKPGREHMAEIGDKNLKDKENKQPGRKPGFESGDLPEQSGEVDQTGKGSNMGNKKSQAV